MMETRFMDSAVQLVGLIVKRKSMLINLLLQLQIRSCPSLLNMTKHEAEPMNRI